MSSKSVTVNPRRKAAQSPPPSNTLSSSANQNKGTILLRNPLPKYSFEQKFVKKPAAHKTDKPTAEIVDEQPDTVQHVDQLDACSGSEIHDKKEVSHKEASDNVEASSGGESVSFGRLVGSFPQTSFPDTLTADNGNVLMTKSGSSCDIHHKDKPVNKVGPLGKNSEKTLAYSVSDSVIVQNVERNEFSPAQSISEQLTADTVSDTLAAPEETGASVQTAGDSKDSHTDGKKGTRPKRTSKPSLAGSQKSGSCKCSEKIQQLEEEKQLLKNQLEVQLQVNQELKKLLVASLGDDLQHRVERLTRDKALMSQEIGDYNKKMCEDYEHLDKISIQADMWRSKYLACRVMTDELASSKAFYSGQFQECQMAMQKLLNERHQLRTNLYDTYRGLSQIQEAFDPLGSQTTGSRLLSSKSTLDLARTNQHLVDTIKYRLLPSHVTSAINSKMEPDWHDYLTQAEAHAQELLSRELRPEDFRCLVPSRGYLSAPGGLSVDRFHPFQKFDNLTLNVCCKCKGEIRIV